MPCGGCLVGVLSQKYADFRALVAGAGGALVASVIRVPQVRGAAPLFLHACVRSCARACVHARCKALDGRVAPVVAARRAVRLRARA